MSVKIMLMTAALAVNISVIQHEVKAIRPPLLWEDIDIPALSDVRNTRSRGKGKTRKQWDVR